MKDEVWGNIYDLGLFLIPEQIEQLEKKHKKNPDILKLREYYLYQYEPDNIRPNKKVRFSEAEYNIKARAAYSTILSLMTEKEKEKN